VTVESWQVGNLKSVGRATNCAMLGSGQFTFEHYTMTDVRSLVRQARDSRRITHPYAKYSAQGVLYCTACTQKIPSEAQWEAHISSAQHKAKVQDAIRESQRKAKRGIAATAMEEEEEEDQSSRKRVKVSEPEPEVVEEKIEETTTTEEQGLPEDFFDEGSKPPKVGVDEDEWKKFQADISEVIRNQEDGDKDEEEEIQRGILDEFDEIDTFGSRVERLKKRREELQHSVKPVQTADVDEKEEDDDDGEVEEEWW
jgi:zinc finger protein 830